MPDQNLHMLKLPQLLNTRGESMVDIMGVVHIVKPLNEFIKDNGERRPKRLVQIADESMNFIQCCFWAEKATIFDPIDKLLA